jgi:hypothetical protein
MRRVPLLLGLALAALALPARAGAPAVDLRWSAPGACPDEAAVRAAVERLVSRPLGDPAEARIHVRITVGPAADAPWSATIAVARAEDPAPRERRLEAPTCAELAEASAVAVALALDPPAPPAPPAPPPPAPPPPRLRPVLRASAGVDLFALPHPAPGAELALGLLFGANRVEIAGAAWIPSTAASVTPGLGAHLSLIAGAARYCRAFLEAPLEIGGCLSFEGGVAGGSAFGPRPGSAGAAPWIAPGARAFGAYPLSQSFALTLALDLLVPLTRTAFSLEAPYEQLHRTPPATGRALAGLEARFR